MRKTVDGHSNRVDNFVIVDSQQAVNKCLFHFFFKLSYVYLRVFDMKYNLAFSILY